MSESKRETKQEYIDRKLKWWEDIYLTPSHKRFDLEAMFEAEWMYNNTPDDHVRTKKDWYDILRGIKDRFKYEEMKPKNKLGTKDKARILYVYRTSSEVKSEAEMYRDMLSDNIILNYVIDSSCAKIETDKYILEFVGKSDTLIGKRVDKYYNLTGDVEFENNVLKRMLRRNNEPKQDNKTGIKCFVGVDRGYSNYQRATLTIIDGNKGVGTSKTFGNGAYKDIAKDIYNEVLKLKPDQIIFNLVGTGIALSEEFKELTVFESNFPNGKETFIIDDKGNITYK